MPAYVIEFLSGQRPQSRRFTLDDDRPLRSQIDQVLAELERVGLVLQGAPSDELAIYVAGRELDVTRSPAMLGITNDRPLELRMQRRRQAVPVPPAPVERPAARFTPKGVYAGAAWGMLAGMIAWTLTTLIEDRSALLASDARLDILAAGLWAGWVALLTAWSDARRSDRPAIGGAVIGMLAAVAMAAGWVATITSLATPDTPTMARVVRVAAWIGLSLTAALSVYLAERIVAVAGGGPGRLGRTLGGALVAGVGAGVVADMPGAVVLWSALASAIAGAGVGASLASAAAHDSTAVLELERRADRSVGIASLREWVMRDGASASVRDVAPGADGAVVHLSYAGGRCHVRAADDTAAGRELRNEDRLIVGRSRYRFRRRGAA